MGDEVGLHNSSACRDDLPLLRHVFNFVLWTDLLFAFAPMIQYQLSMSIEFCKPAHISYLHFAIDCGPDRF